jgi:hypothetical protein
VEQQNNPFGQGGDVAGALLELQILERDVETVPDLGALKMLFYRLEAVSQQAPNDAAVQAGVAQVKQKILARGLELKQAGAVTSTPIPGPASPVPGPSTPFPPPPLGPTQQYGAPPPLGPTQQYAAPPRTPAPDAFPTAGLPAPPPIPGPDYGAPPPAVPPAAPPPAGGAMWKRALIVGGVMGLVGFAGIVYTLRKTRLGLPAPGPAVVAVEVRTAPPGAQIRVNNEARGTSNCKIELAPGSYQVQALLDGFEPAAATLTVAAGAPASLDLTLVPSPLQVKLFADLETGQVLLDDQPAVELQQGQLVLEKIAPGRHTVKITGKDGEAVFGFEVIPGQAPAVAAPITVKNFLAVLVSGAGSAARLHSSLAPLKVALDGQPAGEATAEGLLLQNLRVGDHELALGEGKDQRKLVFSFTPAPMLTAFLKLDLNAGALVVSTGEDDAVIYLNGRTAPGLKTRRGQLRIQRLAVREYAVRVAKEGYLEVPEQKVQIRKGEETRVEFKMVAAPKLAGLRLRGAVPGAQVLVDGNAVGLVYADGTFSNGNVAPGERTIELRRERYAPKQVRKTFRAGETQELTGAELAMELLPGTLRLNVTPAGARIMIKRSDEVQPRPVTDTTLRLPEGTYTIAASAPNHQDNVVTVQLVAGETKTVPLALTPMKAAAAPVKPAAAGMADWDEPGAWVQDGPWLTRRGGNFVTFKVQPVQGLFEFKVGRLRGGRLRWFVNFRDPRNHALFEMDRRRFYRRDVVNGKTIDLARVDHRVESDAEYVMQIEISPTTVTHRIQRGGNWEVLDTWNQSDRDFTAGKFGFRIDGGDQVGLANFSFRPR